MVVLKKIMVIFVRKEHSKAADVKDQHARTQTFKKIQVPSSQITREASRLDMLSATQQSNLDRLSKSISSWPPTDGMKI